MFRIEIAARLKLAPFQRAQILQAVDLSTCGYEGNR